MNIEKACFDPSFFQNTLFLFASFIKVYYVNLIKLYFTPALGNPNAIYKECCKFFKSTDTFNLVPALGRG
ncbi:hypothetical protein COL20_22730 [Bacillus sp. AFS075034]|nr:hypothetical protein COL20_22730 [Bacillus sp. AFS075034]